MVLLDCWICGAPADSAEHMVKASDIRSHFGKVSQTSPIYRHVGDERNVPVRGVDTPSLKFKPSICQACNNARTQSHDRAWESLSTALRSFTAPLRKGQRIKLDAVLGADYLNLMANVQLYFVKQLGCYAVEHRVPLPLKSMAVAILSNVPHPHVFLTFAAIESNREKKNVYVGTVRAVLLGNELKGATWFYILGEIGILVTYSEQGRPGERSTWHPEDRGPYLYLAQ
jgi:hypothetical protein